LLAASRDAGTADRRFYDLGFRVALDFFE